MYYIGILIYLFVVGFLFNFSTEMKHYIDFPSLVVVLGITAIIIVSSGLAKDLVNGFKLMKSRVNTFSLIELKKMEIAVRLAIKSILLSGVLGTMSGTIAILSNIEVIEHLWPSFGVAILTLMYAIVITFLLMPIASRIRATIASLE